MPIAAPLAEETPPRWWWLLTDVERTQIVARLTASGLTVRHWPLDPKPSSSRGPNQKGC